MLLHILHLEDNSHDAELIQAMLVEDGLEFSIKVVDTAEAFTTALAEYPPDIILADYSLPSFDGLSALKIVKEQYPDIPFILVSGSLGEEFAINSLKCGATDYILKTNLNRFIPAVKRALHEKEEYYKRRQAEEKIQRLNAAIEHSSDAVVTTGPDGTIEYVNQAFENITGYQQMEVLGRKTSLLKSGKHDKAFYKDLWQTILAGRTWRGIMTNRKKDGSFYTEDSTISPILAENGEISGFVAIKRDITLTLEIERRRHHDQVVRRRLADIFLAFPDDKMYEEVLRLILENLESEYGLIGYIGENDDLVIPSLTGDVWGKCRVPGKTVTFPHKTWDGRWAQALKEKKAFFVNESLQMLEGHIHISNAVFAPIIYRNEAIGLLTIANKKTDYTEDDHKFLTGICEYIAPILHARLQRDKQEKRRQQAEGQLKEYSEKLKQMVDERTRELNNALSDAENARERVDGIIKSIAGGLIVTDKYNKIILMNRPAETLLDIHFSEVFKQSIDISIIDPEIWQEVLKAVAEEKTYTFDIEIPHVKSDKPIFLRARTSGLYDKFKENSGVVMLMNDITHEQEMDRLKTEFITTVAHQFKTPLTSIQGFSEILLTRNDLQEKEREKFLTHINKQAVNLAMIVSDLLDVARIEAETVFSLNKTTFRLSSLIDVILPFFKESYPEHDFKVTLSKESDAVFADKGKIGQVFENVISNAVKYSPKGSTIEVTGELLGSCYQVAIKDHGIGMTSEQVDKIFDKFYRADNSDGAVEGTGLGMTIVKYIIEVYGGKVLVNSEPGVGTTVHFTVPTNISKKE